MLILRWFHYWFSLFHYFRWCFRHYFLSYSWLLLSCHASATLLIILPWYAIIAHYCRQRHDAILLFCYAIALAFIIIIMLWYCHDAYFLLILLLPLARQILMMLSADADMLIHIDIDAAAIIISLLFYFADTLLRRYWCHYWYWYFAILILFSLLIFAIIIADAAISHFPDISCHAAATPCHCRRYAITPLADTDRDSAYAISPLALRYYAITWQMPCHAIAAAIDYYCCFRHYAMPLPLLLRWFWCFAIDAIIDAIIIAAAMPLRYAIITPLMPPLTLLSLITPLRHWWLFSLMPLPHWCWWYFIDILRHTIRFLFHAISCYCHYAITPWLRWCHFDYCATPCHFAAAIADIIDYWLAAIIIDAWCHWLLLPPASLCHYCWLLLPPCHAAIADATPIPLLFRLLPWLFLPWWYAMLLPLLRWCHYFAIAITLPDTPCHY